MRSHLGLGRDIFPVLFMKLETPALYLRPEKSPVEVAEGGIAAQHDIDDYANAPHVDRLQERVFVRQARGGEERRSKDKELPGWRTGVDTEHHPVDRRMHNTV